MTSPVALVESSSATGGALQVRNFRIFLVGQTISNVGTWFQSLAQSLLIVQLTGSGAELGAVAALQFAPLLLLGSLAGAVADRRDCRVTLVWASTAAGCAAVALGALTVAGHGTAIALLGAALLLGMCQAFERPAAQTLISELVPPGRVVNGLSLFTVSASAARLIGPAVGGLLYATIGPGGCFFINAGSFVAALISVLALRTGELWPRERTSGTRGDVRGGFRYAWRTPALRTTLLANALVGLLAFNFVTTVTALVTLTLHGSSVQVGLAHAVNALGAVCGGLLVGRRARVGERQVAWWCLGLGVALVAVAASGTVTLVLVLAPGLGLAIGGYQAGVAGFVQSRSKPQMLGRMLGLMTMGSMGTTAFGGLLIGWIIEAWSVPGALLVGAASCLLAALPLSRVRSGLAA